MAAPSPVTMRWRLQTTASVARTWALLSDTDRFNRVAGKNDSYVERPLPDGTVERIGSMRRVGIRLRWVEAPFEWLEPHQFSVRRVFQGGPASHYEVNVALSELASGGTEIAYQVDVHPRLLVTRPAVLADAKLFTRPGLDRALTRAIEVLDGRRPVFDDPAPPLSHAAEALLSRGLQSVRSPTVAKRLGAYLRAAPLVAQQNLAPLRLARQWGVPEAETLVAFMDAVAGGVLSLTWELRCPSCRASKGQAPRLGAGPREVHCPSCNLPFDGALPDNLLAGFRPDARVRVIDLPIRCIGSPARTPHLVAQRILSPGETTILDVSLLPGAYRLRTFPATSTLSLQVRLDVAAREAALQVRGGELLPGLLRLGHGRVRLNVDARGPRPLTLVVERTGADRDVLTAGRLLEFDDTRAAIPNAMLHPDLDVAVERGIVLAARIARGGDDARDNLERALRTWRPVSLLARKDTVIAVFGDGHCALSAASLLDGAYHVGAGLSAGLVVTRAEGEHRVPCGAVVQRCLDLADAAGGGAVLLGADDAADTELARLLDSDGVAVDRSPVATEPLVLHLSHPARTSPPLSADVAPAKVGPGLLIDGRYRLETRLGDGGFGSAWSASDPHGAKVVIKLLHARLANDPVQVQRFFNEGRLAQTLNSAWIARVYDYGRGQAGHLYLAMEHLSGEDLWHHSRREGPLAPPLACAFAIDVLHGLEDAHAIGLVHRDVKPANIILSPTSPSPDQPATPQTPQGRPMARLIDFGVARSMASADPRLTSDGQAIGTPYYMAPEQVECGAVDGRADLYALASLLYECLSGRLPFKGNNTMALLIARVRDEPIPLAEAVTGELLPALVDVVMRALARDPEDRPADARTMRLQLEALMPALQDARAAGQRTQELAMADTVGVTPGFRLT